MTSSAASTATPAASAVADCLESVRQRIDGEVRADAYSRVLYSTDASIYQAMPLGVVIPRSADDVHATVECAAEHGVPILARAAGSSLAGQAVNEALVLDTSRYLDAVLEIDPAAHTVRVQPGIVLDELNAALRKHGLAFGPDPASSDRAGIGGVVSNNSTGAHSILYGMTADHVLEMNVVLADGSLARFEPLENEALPARCSRTGLEGEIYRRMVALAGDTDSREIVRKGTPRHWRRCGGYNLDRLIHDGMSFLGPPDRRFNLAKLVSGGEGGLAVITDVTLNLVSTPGCRGLALLHFDSLHRALSSVPTILESEPSAVELLDHLAMTLCRGVREYARLLDAFVEGDPDCVLICEFQGDTQAEVKAGFARLEDLVRRGRVGAETMVRLLEPARQQDVWAVRKVALGLLMSIRGDHKPIPFIEDAAVPVEHLADYVAEIERFCAELGTRVAYYAHASAGCLHIRPLIDAKQAVEVAKMPEIQAFSVELLHGYGGALSSEHGDGRARSWINERFFGPELYRLYQEVKRTFDPHGLLNPGTVVDAPPMTESLRYGESYRTVELRPRLDFSGEQGFNRAVEMCNGAGVCRRRDVGTMCPSFMVTREEEHSTRGRANALRAAMSGVLPVKELTSRRMYEVMELCVECKACKAECPSSVDMAKIKTEFLAGYHAEHGVSLRDRLFGRIDRLSRLAAGWPAPLVNAVLGSRGVRAVLESILGIERSRPLPRFARRPFTDWFDHHAPRPESPRGRVVLFNDTFNTYCTPHVAQAATELLVAAGFEVLLPGSGCCGRPMLSKGLVDEARAAATDTVARLESFVRQGLPIIGLEPSCLLTLRDDYTYLLPENPLVGAIAERAETLEEFVARRAAAGELDLELRKKSQPVLLHGHCHQKALVGTEPAKRALELVTQREIVEVDSGCCGMAGSFGYEVEHYETSLAMAEQRLLPEVRRVSEETLLVAAGMSCRQQIEHGTGRRALHPAEVLRSALTGEA